MRMIHLLALAVLVAGFLAFAPNAGAQYLTYFDSDLTGYEITDKSGTTPVAPNTTLVDGSPVTVTGDGSGTDDLWRQRVSEQFGNRARPQAGSGGLLADTEEDRV